jgi:hypothetical protein
MIPVGGGGNGITVHGNRQPQAGVKPSHSPAQTTAASGDAGITATVTNTKPAPQQAPLFAAENARKFLQNVLVWPADINSPHGWINAHVNAKNEAKPALPDNGTPSATKAPVNAKRSFLKADVERGIAI